MCDYERSLLRHEKHMIICQSDFPYVKRSAVNCNHQFSETYLKFLANLLREVVEKQQNNV